MPYTYTDICNALAPHPKARGIQRSFQTDEQRLEWMRFGRGICMGLTIEWLGYKRRKQPFPSFDAAFAQQFSAKPGKADAMWNKFAEAMASAQRAQAAHTANTDLAELLRERGFKGKLEELRNQAEEGPLRDLRLGVELIAESPYNYYWLLINGESGGVQRGHAIAAHRPWLKIGKSEIFSLFDPNVGEFEVDVAAGKLVMTMLLANYADIMTDRHEHWVVGIE